MSFGCRKKSMSAPTNFCRANRQANKWKSWTGDQIQATIDAVKNGVPLQIVLHLQVSCGIKLKGESTPRGGRYMYI